jgi:hypothetical protein
MNPFSVRVVTPQSGSVHQIAALAGGGFVATVRDFVWGGQSSEFSLVELDESGIARSRRTRLEVRDGRLPAGEISDGYQHVMCINPSGTSVAVAYKTAGRLDIVDIADGAQVQARVPFAFLPVISVNPRTGRSEFQQSNENIRAAYIGCAATDRYIFATFSGKRVREFPGRLPGFCRFVHVFDWSGDLAAIVSLDHDTGAIAVDEKGEFLYSIDLTGTDARPAIRETRLPVW